MWTVWRTVIAINSVLTAVRSYAERGPVITCVVNPGPLPLAARVAHCAVSPCEFILKEEAIIDIAFRAPRDISTLTTTVEVYLTMLGIDIPIPFDLADKSDTCNYLLNSTCPVRESEIILYTLKLFIGPPLPVGLKTVMEISIMDETSSVACIRVPLVVKSRPTILGH